MNLLLANRSTCNESTGQGLFATIAEDGRIVAKIRFGTALRGGCLRVQSHRLLWQLDDYVVSSRQGDYVFLVPIVPASL